MLFNSIDFAIFLPLVFLLYWFIFNKSLKLQNILILVSSYIFYGWWDWRFLILIFVSTLIDYTIGILIDQERFRSKKKILLVLSLSANLGILGFFKYFNFFIDNFNQAFTLLGTSFNVSSLNLILPVGISFYTFQTMSYTIDVYNGKLKSTNNFIDFSAFVSFFPQLVAGPIERATHLLPQFQKTRKFIYQDAVYGSRQILWGFFKKLVIADNCAEYANIIFNNSNDYSGSTLLLGAFFFTFQIYGDFSGYSDIASGVSRLFGFDLMQNFNYPYFSRDIAEFWRRWHISLSTWFRDYLYFPLGGSKGNKYNQIRNIFIVFIVSGFWHGANWTFIFWGLLNALYFLPLIITNNNRKNLDIVAEGKIFPKLKDFWGIIITFIFTNLAWIFFRADSLSHAFSIFGKIFSKSLFVVPEILPFKTIVLIIFFVIVEWYGRHNSFAIKELFLSKYKIIRFCTYLFFILVIFYFGNFKENVFIYFQF